MRWTRETELAKNSKKYPWKDWFAWYPVIIKTTELEHTYVWLETVSRNKWIGLAYGNTYCDYREKE